MSQFFAEAEVLIRPNTTGFAAALVAKVNEEVLAAQAAIKPVIVPATIVSTTAGKGALAADAAALSGANVGLAASATKSSDAIRSEGSAVQKTSQALRAHNAELAATARAHSQFQRGTEATALSLLGVRGATLAASSAFLAGAASIVITAKSISAASDRVEQLNKSVEVFSTSAEGVRKWSETTATAMGISQTAALKAASTYGQLFRTLGVGAPEAARLSESLVKLASDLASFNNVPVDRALAAIQSGLVGQARPLRALGVFLTEARVKQEALVETGKKNASSLTQQDRILARYALIIKDSALASGDFERTQGRLANQSRVLSAQISDLSASLGAALTPAVTEAVSGLNIGITAVQKFIDNLKKLPKTVDVAVHVVTQTDGKTNQGGGGGIDIPGVKLARTVAGGLFFVVPILQRYIDSQKDAAKATRDSQEAAVEDARALRDMGSALDVVSAAARRMAAEVRGAQHAADVLAQQQEQIQAGVIPGGRSAEERNLAAQIAAQQKIIDTAKVGSKAYRDALREKKRLIDELASLQAQDAADAQAAAQKIQTARDKADQLIQDAISRATGKADLRKAIAAGTAGTLDDLNAAIHERAVIRQLIRELVPRIKDERTRATVLAQLRAAEVQTNNEVKALQEERRKARQAARQAAIDARETHLQAMLSIAETTTSTRDDLTALRALAAFYERRIAELKKIRHRNQEQNAALDAYRVSLAQTNESIRNITKEAQKGNTFAQQAFAFLQTQQGFVSNLLGNLIPFGATSGLVGGQGGGAPTIPAQATVRQVAGGFEQPRGVNFTAGEAVRTRPPSGQQAERQIDWLRKIYAALVDLKRGSEHPEAKNQRASGAAAMDYARSGMGMGIG